MRSCLVAISLYFVDVSLVPAQSPQPHGFELDKLIQESDELVKVGKYRDAIPIDTRALALSENTFGPEHPKTAAAVSHLGMSYLLTADYAKAEPLLERGVKINEKVLGQESPQTAMSITYLAMLYQLLGDYAKAEPYFQRALKIDEKVLGPDHLMTGFAVNTLAMLHQMMGDYAKAEPLYQRALRIYEKALGPENLTTGAGLNALAMLYQLMGDYTKAEPLYRRAITIYEKSIGPEHPSTAIGLSSLAQLYWKMRDYAKAEPLYQRALKISENMRGPQHPDTANCLTGLALLYEDMGESAKAERFYQRALKARETMLGTEHYLTGISLENLALLHIASGNRTPQTFELMRRADKAQEIHLSNILSFTSEEQRLVFQKTTSPYDLAGTLGAAGELAEMVLREKGAVLDSLLEDRLAAEASNDPKDRETIAELRGLKQQLVKLELETLGDVSEQARNQRDADRSELTSRVAQLEGELARHITGLGRARRALAVTVPQVQAALLGEETLIELVRYQHYLGRHSFETRYGAVIISKDSSPTWAPFRAAAEIEKNIRLYQNSARGKTDEATLSDVLRNLHDQVWAPIEKALPTNTKTVIVSPDGELNFVSFATLIGSDNKFVGEKYHVRYVASGRDLLHEIKIAGNSQTNIYANPDFGGKAIAPNEPGSYSIALRSVEMRDLQTMLLLPLPGTEAEANALKKRFGESAKLFLGRNATKAQLQQLQSPHVLHLATHGFFLPEIDLGKAVNPLQPGGQEIPKGKLVNPMHRSGLALAGAQTTLQAWARGEVPPIENNGIVTAEEVGGLKLDGTWLVVLSACETGLGEARAGEGVMGLRRGFIQAGAQNLLMTLWPISDQTTVQIMLDFYNAAEKSKNAPQALADVQRDWLVKLRKERGLLESVRLSGPFIMSSQGRQ